MPPKSRSKKQFSNDKEKIVEQALKIIEIQGLNALTMRKLASKMGMSATNLYNYFYNKDELYLYILVQGFNLLKAELESSIETNSPPLQQLENYLRIFIHFGLEHQGYYHLMMSTKDPKAMDYDDESLVDLAKYEKSNAMSVFYLLESIVKSCLLLKTSNSDSFIITSRIICEIHGFINLTHSNIIREIGANSDFIIDNLIESILLEFH
ncbi:TetR/AcrR family transcriptional regulator [Eubacterium callanderi]|uniref:TetR/AcrR family transcriptional regulator n=1 Tax=Eubacterium callanderi TaxID=53442 RepID=UPI001C2D3EA2|nr:TetR/AcrR family transcriptional regulator [Eubacterium callanderi]MBV1684063.1 TetR/AcrR family transcriptional regulator [Eubacterium callanderi]